jgi:hypothetical protein
MVQETPNLKSALYYFDRLGWCIIPIPHGRKKARVKWKRCQTERPDREQVQKWFGNGKLLNMAVVLGPVSGDLCCRDFDVAESYQVWAESHPELAERLPTVRTAKGYHVYFRADWNGIKHLGDGELRGTGGYCMLPPSVHPDGATYEWIIPPTAENLLALDPVLAGFMLNDGLVTEQTEQPENTETPEQTETTEQTEAIEWGEGVEEAIRATLPSEYGTRNRKVFEFARTLRSLPQFADADPRDLRAIVREWHRRALPKIRTKVFEETWIDFLKAWPRVRHPKGTEPMMQTFLRAVESDAPRIAVVNYPENQRLQIFVALCRELQRAAGVEPFYLSCRTAGRLFSVSHTEAARWFFLLESDRILEVVNKGGTSKNPRNATRFRYLGD